MVAKMDNLKQCKKCGEWKDKDNGFGKRKSSKDGYKTICKRCKSEYDKKYREKNKELIIEKRKKYYQKNKENIKEKSKNYREENIEKHKKDKKNYSIKNQKELKEYRKLYYKSFCNFNSDADYRKEIELYEEIKISTNGNLMCKCAYCGEWFEPTIIQILFRIRSMNNLKKGEGRLYCSQNCKNNCPIYNQRLYPKDHKPATSREVQPELRQMVFKRDNYTCQKCGKHRDNLEVGIHCHHKEGILWEPLQSADMDMCITLCEDCHK